MERVLFITPVLPDANGGGREKRAHQWVTTLSGRYQLSLLLLTHDRNILNTLTKHDFLDVVELSYSKYDKFIQSIKFLFGLFIGKGCGVWRLNWAPFNKRYESVLSDKYINENFKKIICFRFYLSDFAFFLNSITNNSVLELDMDDVESTTRAKIARLLFRNRLYKKSFGMFLSSAQFYFLEKKLVKQFGRVYLCSEEDNQMLSKRFSGVDFITFPNRIYGQPKQPIENENKRDLLFVGSFGYYPNEEAVKWFAKNVFEPLYERDATWTLNLVGYGASEELKKQLSHYKGINLYSNLPSLEKIYKECSIVIAPLHAGGGTKLKVLEALWYGKPLIATYEAVHGLGLSPNVHYLPAETSDVFISQCERLSFDAKVYRQLIDNAFHVMQEKYCYVNPTSS